MKKVIDVSSYNSVVNWKSAKKQGVDGAILKIIRKDLTRDNQFNNNYKGCESAGIPWGVYNYSYATTTSKAKSDMKLVCDILDKISSKKYFTLGVWFDIEDKAQASLSKSAIANIINAAQKVVESRGYKFGVYTGLAYYKEHMDTNKIDCKRWWIARYYKGYDTMKFGTNPNEKYKPLSDCWAWQYTSSGTFSPKICNGNDGNVDISVLYETTKNEKVSILIGSARIDERGKASGGAAGDQKQTSSTNDTKGEVSIQNFYVHSKGWYVLRPKDAAVAIKIAKAMKTACNNKNIGYDQENRLGVTKYGTATKVKTECDCSSLVRQCVKEASGKDPGNFTTANEPDKLEATGLFEDRIAYVPGMKIYTGDVLVTKTKGHTVIAVEGYSRDSNTTTSTTKKKSYSGIFPALPPRGYYKLGDGYKTLANYTTQIKRVQKFLNWAIAAGLKVDGDYGEKTAAAVATFQKKYGLTVDKEFGEKSLAKAKTIKK